MHPSYDRASVYGWPPCLSLSRSSPAFVCTSDPLSVDEALAFVADPGAGGTCVFIGTVRDHSNGGRRDGAHYEAWDELADRAARGDRRRDPRALAR